MEAFLFVELLPSNSYLICHISVEKPHGDILSWQSTETYYLQLPRNLFGFSQVIVGHLCMSFYNLEIHSVLVTLSIRKVLPHFSVVLVLKLHLVFARLQLKKTHFIILVLKMGNIVGTFDCVKTAT